MWSRNIRRAAKPAVAAGLVVTLGACADYLNRHDTVTLAAGNAQAWNRVAQTTDPWPPYVRRTDIDGDGQRIKRVVDRYSTGTEYPAPRGDETGESSVGTPQTQTP